MPIIFASILTTIPATIVALIGKQGAIDFVNKYIIYTSDVGFILYMLLIVFFGYFYTFLIMNPEEIGKNLNERGGYIPGIRPGKDTENYLSDSIGKLTLVGSIFLIILAAMPVLMSKFVGLSQSITIGGTGMLIIVGVAIETYKQLESSLVSRSYTEKRKRLR
jgi:preprotein translocase subunit SecY